MGKIKEELIEELDALHWRVAELEGLGNQRQRAEVAFQGSEVKFCSVVETTVSTILIYRGTMRICCCRY